ncbi:MAG: hypothetical protein L6R35_003945 [Caloplaca aegaea]|nr:MAG: hypothetical protein L6R35_003945 [Caloplaca aegaea]
MHVYYSGFAHRFKRHHDRSVGFPEVGEAHKALVGSQMGTIPGRTPRNIHTGDRQAATMLNATSMFLFSLVSFLFTNLTAAAPSNLTTPGLSASYECWRSPGVSLVYRDCVELIRYQLGFPHDPTVPMTFSRKKEAMILIPYAKISPRGNCNIVLGIRGNTLGTEVEKWENIKEVALEIAISCVIKEPHGGGYAWMGEQNNLLVSMVGRDTGTALLRKDDVVVKDDMTFYAT